MGCTDQLERVEWELNELNRLLEADTLYEPPKVLYHEPHEVPGHLELLAHLQSFEPRLKLYLGRRYTERHAALLRQKEEFRVTYKQWERKLKALEANDPPVPSPVMRPVEPVVAPPISGGRSGRRAGDVVRSEAELNQILLSLLEQERDNPATRWMATLAVTPKMFTSDVKHVFDDIFVDRNGKLDQDHYQKQVQLHKVCPLVAASVVHFKGSVVWTEGEQRIFVDKFLAFPKNFRKIASYLPFKRTSDCVAFYYQNKKHLRLKQLRKLAASEANLGKVKPGPRKITLGPGRPPKKARKPGRPPKYPRPPVVSSTEDEDLDPDPDLDQDDGSGNGHEFDQELEEQDEEGTVTDPSESSSAAVLTAVLDYAREGLAEYCYESGTECPPSSDANVD